jgi:hypothetical protein
MDQEQHTRLIPVPKWPDYHPWPSISGLRNLIFWANQNGFDKVIKRVGQGKKKRVLIDEKALFQWVEEQQGGLK